MRVPLLTTLASHAASSSQAVSNLNTQLLEETHGLSASHWRSCQPACALALPEVVAQCSLTDLREKLIKIGAKVVRHARYAVFQMAEVAVSKELFEKILCLIERLRPDRLPG